MRHGIDDDLPPIAVAGMTVMDVVTTLLRTPSGVSLVLVAATSQAVRRTDSASSSSYLFTHHSQLETSVEWFGHVCRP